MVKKFLLILLLVLLPAAALAEAQIIDNANLFTASDMQEMETVITRIENEHQVDMVVLTTRDTPDDYSESMWRVRDYADNFYDQGGYGMGEDDSGMLILLDMNNRVMWLSTGGVMIEYINDDREDDILDRAYSYLASGDYSEAILVALKRVERLMESGRAEGTFLYDEATGRRLGGIYNALTAGEMLLAAVVGAGAALVVCLSVSGSYNLKGKTYSYDRDANASIVLTKDDETFLRQTVSRAHRNTGSHGPHGGGAGRSGGSGVHRSSGGVRHGGGGRRF